MKIAIDMDDTIFKTEQTIYPYICDYFKLPYEKIIKDNTFNYAKIKELDGYEEFTKNNWEKIVPTAELYENAKEVINELYDSGVDITILTARNLLEYKNPFETTSLQLETHGIKYSRIEANVYEKGKYCVDNNIICLIDDSVRQFLTCPDTVKVIMPNRRFNEYFKCEYKPNDWLEIKNIINEMKASN